MRGARRSGSLDTCAAVRRHGHPTREDPPMPLLHHWRRPVAAAALATIGLLGAGAAADASAAPAAPAGPGAAPPAAAPAPPAAPSSQSCTTQLVLRSIELVRTTSGPALLVSGTKPHATTRVALVPEDVVYIQAPDYWNYFVLGC